MERVPEKEKSTALSLNERRFDPDQDICNAPSNSNQCANNRMGSERGMLEIKHNGDKDKLDQRD